MVPSESTDKKAPRDSAEQFKTTLFLSLKRAGIASPPFANGGESSGATVGWFTRDPKMGLILDVHQVKEAGAGPTRCS
jgi:hypothetical protein